MEEVTHTCYIEVDGNVITRDANGTLISEFTGNWSILHKIYRFATMSAIEKQKHKQLSPDLYIGTIRYIMRHPGTNQHFVVSSTQIKRILQYITNPNKIQFGGINELNSSYEKESDY